MTPMRASSAASASIWRISAPVRALRQRQLHVHIQVLHTPAAYPCSMVVPTDISAVVLAALLCLCMCRACMHSQPEKGQLPCVS